MLKSGRKFANGFAGVIHPENNAGLTNHHSLPRLWLLFYFNEDWKFDGVTIIQLSILNQILWPNTKTMHWDLRPWNKDVIVSRINDLFRYTYQRRRLNDMTPLEMLGSRERCDNLWAYRSENKNKVLTAPLMNRRLCRWSIPFSGISIFLHDTSQTDLANGHCMLKMYQATDPLFDVVRRNWTRSS